MNLHSLLDETNAFVSAFLSGTLSVHEQIALLAACVALLSFLVMLRPAGSSKAQPKEQDSDLLKSGLLGKFTRIEQSFNQDRTESKRFSQLARRELDEIKEEIRRLKLVVGEEALSKVAPLETKETEVEQLSPLEAAGDESAEEKSEGTETKLESEAAPAALSTRLGKTRQGLLAKLKSVFAKKAVLDSDTLEELEGLLVSSDLGVQTTNKLLDGLKDAIGKNEAPDEEGLRNYLREHVVEILKVGSPESLEIIPEKHNNRPLVVMLVGVNGVGKTTSVAKLASQFKARGAKVLMVAADTFRAAAVEQLMEWGRRLDVPVISGASEARPQTVVFDALQKANDDGLDVVIIDTAGRLHTKSSLMQELEGISNIVKRFNEEGPDESILVLDAATGQNAIQQAREFQSAVPLSGIILTKLDGTPKGGIVVAIKDELGLPIRYIGVGESSEDLRPFNADAFAAAIFNPEEEGSEEKLSAHAMTRRNKSAALL